MPVDDTATPLTFGARVRQYRERAGMTRAVLGGLVGRSAEWVKSIECGRTQMPRLALLLRLADILSVRDLASLTGNERLAAATYTKGSHDALPAVRHALTTYRLGESLDEPPAVDELERRVREAWGHWHAGGDHRTRIAVTVPDLLADLQAAPRALTGGERRRALIALAQVYHLAQLFLSFQPAAELVMLTGDRAMAAAQDADDPYAIAGAAWYMNHVFRDAGERHDARVDLAMHAADLLRPDAGPEDAARWGLLQLAAALSFAKVGRKGDAWRYWDRADDAARRLGDGYTHPWLVFGQGMVDAYAITMHIDLAEPARAIEVAGALDLTGMPSATRRSFHAIETARAYSARAEPLAVVHLLKDAVKTSPETVRYNLFARGAVSDLAAEGNVMIRRDVAALADRIGVIV